MRRCPLPSPITLSTIKQLFINLFDLNPSITNDPKWHLFMLNRSNTWKPLNIVKYVYSIGYTSCVCVCVMHVDIIIS